MSSQPSKKSYKRFIIPTVIIIMIIVFFSPIIPHQVTVNEYVPYQVTKNETITLINDKPTIPAGKYLYYRVYIDVSGKERNVVFGSVVETAGYDINFYVFDQKGFNAWREGYSVTPYVSAKRITSYDFSFVPDHSDYYYFVLDNGYSWFTNKVPQITAQWYYQRTVTEYKTVQTTVTEYKTVQKTITEYKTIQKTVIEYKSLFQLLTGG
jgi:hypothetical protein